MLNVSTEMSCFLWETETAVNLLEVKKAIYSLLYTSIISRMLA